MSILGDMFAGLQQVMTLGHRVEELTKEVGELKRREQDTRERILRLEIIIDEARQRGAARRLPDA